MSEKPLPTPLSTPAPTPPRRSSRANVEDPMIELTERAKVISQEAGTKVTGAMREMIGAAAGIAGFAVESARDLVQYMVRRGQMTQEEADKLIRDAEATHMKKPKAERDRLAAMKAATDKAAAEKKAAMQAAEQARPVHRVTTPGRILAQGAGKSVKQMPAAKSTDATKAADKHGAKIPEKAPPKVEKVKAQKVAAKPVAKSVSKPAKAAPAKAARARKSAAKAPAKKSAKKKR